MDPSDPGYRPASGSASASTSPLARGGRDEESRGSFAGGRHEGHSDLDGPWAEDKAPRPQAFLPWYRDRGCIMAVTGYGLVAIVYCLIDELVPVFASTEPSRGGLGLTERDFSVPLGVGGAVLILYTLVVAPVIVAKVGHGPSVVYSLVLQAPMALLIPATGSFPGRALAYAGFVVAYAVKCACGVTAFTGWSTVEPTTLSSQELDDLATAAGLLGRHVECVAALQHAFTRAQGAGDLPHAVLGVYLPFFQRLLLGHVVGYWFKRTSKVFR